MDIYGQLVERIIKEQETIIGPVALDQARKVSGLTVDLSNNEIAFSGDKKEILESLVRKYEALFGPASIEVCKDAVKDIITKAPKDQVPALLL